MIQICVAMIRFLSHDCNTIFTVFWLVPHVFYKQPICFVSVYFHLVRDIIQKKEGTVPYGLVGELKYEKLVAFTLQMVVCFVVDSGVQRSVANVYSGVSTRMLLPAPVPNLDWTAPAATGWTATAGRAAATG